MSNSLASLTPGVWNVDPSHSTVGFTARHLMITKVRGRFAGFTGTITIAADPLQSSVVAEAQTATVTTGDENRDGHLKGEDFFDVAKYPTVSFASTAIRAAGSDYVLVGDLTIKGITKSLEFALEFEGVEKDPWGGTRASFTATTEINRKEWGLEFNVVLDSGGMLVGDKVKLELDIQAVKA